MPGQGKSFRSSGRTKWLLHTALACVLAFGFFWPFRFQVDAPFWERLMDAAHLPLFFGITCWFNRLWPSTHASASRRLLKICGAAIALAATVEVIQPWTGRTESLVDFRNGIFGAVAGAAALLLLRTNSPRWWMVFVPLLMVTLVITFWPAGQEWQAMRWRQHQFPVLGDFESKVELRLWTPQGGSSNSLTQVQLTSSHMTHGAQALKIVTGNGSWAGVSFAAGEENWSGRSRLAADLFNPAEAFSLGVRVDDDGDCSTYGRRFDRECPLITGWNHLEFSAAEMERGPANRKLNLRSIRRLVFFTGQDQPSRTFFLDNVRLE